MSYNDFEDDFELTGWAGEAAKAEWEKFEKGRPGQTANSDRDAGAKVVELCERRSDKKQGQRAASAGRISGKKSNSIPYSNTGETVPKWNTEKEAETVQNDPYNFCDWLTIRVAIKHSKGILGDKIQRINPDGVEAWSRDLWKTVENEASSSSTVSVKSLTYQDVVEPFLRMKQSDKFNWRERVILRYGAAIDEKTEDYLFLDISGNPTKFLQGQNIWGSDDLRQVCRTYIKTVLQQLKLWEVMTKKERKDVMNLRVWITRFDLTTNFDFENAADKSVFLGSVAQQAESKRGKKQAINTTVYFGSAEYMQVKFYDKLAEVLFNMPKLKHAESAESQKDALEYRKFVEKVHTEILGLVRCELRLGRSFIRKNCGMYLVNVLDYIEKGGLIMREIKKLKLGQKGTTVKNLKDAQKVLEQMARAKTFPRSVVGSFVQWKNGETVSDLLPRTTFYRHRKEIMAAVDIDISLVRVEEKKRRAKIVPLIREIEAIPARPSASFDDYIFPHSVHG